MMYMAHKVAISIGEKRWQSIGFRGQALFTKPNLIDEDNTSKHLGCNRYIYIRSDCSKHLETLFRLFLDFSIFFVIISFWHAGKVQFQQGVPGTTAHPSSWNRSELPFLNWRNLFLKPWLVPHHHRQGGWRATEDDPGNGESHGAVTPVTPPKKRWRGYISKIFGPNERGNMLKYVEICSNVQGFQLCEIFRNLADSMLIAAGMKCVPLPKGRERRADSGFARKKRAGCGMMVTYWTYYSLYYIQRSANVGAQSTDVNFVCNCLSPMACFEDPPFWLGDV